MATTVPRMSLEEESVESRLQTQVAEVLGLHKENIQLLDSFVELGGDQETAAELRKSCRDVGMAVRTKDILRCQTLAELQTCVTPCVHQPVSGASLEPAMDSPPNFHKASRLSVDSAAKSSEPWRSHNSSLSSIGQPQTDLEEVLCQHKLVRQVTSITPKAGLLDGKLVVLLQLAGLDFASETQDDTPNLCMIPAPLMFFAGTQVGTLRRLVESSPGAEVVPDAWVVLKRLPVNETGEIDRRCVRTWAQNINEDTYRQIVSLRTEETLQGPSTDMEKTVRSLVGKVLQLPQDSIGVNFTFGQLGGDELAAMDLVARCRHESIYLSANEVLEKCTLADLAAAAVSRGGLVHKWEEDDAACFDLSPMQKLYFSTPMGSNARRGSVGTAGASYRFNQGHLLRVTKPCMVDDICAAVEAVVGHHPMLRSRFVRQGGGWSQRILPEVSSSYRFCHHVVGSDNEVEAAIEISQAAIDIESGPTFSADYFKTRDGHQMLYLVAHHLVVDLPSWRIIIHDLDELLETGSLLSTRSMPFPKWVELQTAAAREFEFDASPLPFECLDQSYWGLGELPNSYEDAVETQFSLSAELTSILQNTCNLVFRTDAVDIYLATLMLSFAQTFPDRPCPTVWNQEHGRESWSPDIDISETVGWFTCLSPIVQKVEGTDDYVDVLRRLKDIRRLSPMRSSLFFASKFYRPESKSLFSVDDPFEVVFSNVGSIQQLERQNGVLEQTCIPGQTLVSRTSDVGPSVGRAALFEVNTLVDQGVAKIKFVYNRHSKHQDRISSWVSNYEHLLLEAIGRLRYHAQELTLADVPYLDVTYQGLNKLNKNSIRSLKLTTMRDIEAVYPVTVTQQRILVAQAQKPEAHFLHHVWELTTPNGAIVDTSRICAAWQFVTKRHAALRTVFMESVTETGLYDQIILQKTSPEMLFIDTVPPEDPLDELNRLPDIRVTDIRPPHRLTVCKTPIKTLVKLDISAAICDSNSMHVLLRDLWQAYSTQKAIPGTVQFSYSSYLGFLKTARKGESIRYWKGLLQNMQPCSFPSLSSTTASGHFSAVNFGLDVQAPQLTAFLKTQQVSVEALLQLAWALVLRAFHGSSSVCFAFSTAGREASVDGMAEAVGSFTNTTPCAITLLPHHLVSSVLRATEQSLSLGLTHQYVSIPEIQHALCLEGGQRLFNTGLSYTEDVPNPDSELPTPTALDFKSILQQHHGGLDLSLDVHCSHGTLSVDIYTCIMSEQQALDMANTFGEAIRAVLSSADSSVGGLSLFSDRDYAQIVSWSDEAAEPELKHGNTVVQDLVTRYATNNPDSQAVCAWDGDLSYHQILDHATRLAHHLVDRGVGPHAVVPVVLEKSRWAPVAILAVLRTGAAFVPIDAEELGSTQSIFGQLNARVVIATEQAASVIDSLFEHVVILGESLFSEMPPLYDSLPSIATPNDTACILFQPASNNKEVRGLAFTHRALSTAFLAQGPALRISTKTRVIQLSSFGVDIALSEIFVTLAHGGCLCIPSSAERLNNYTAAVRRMRVNWSYMTPFLSRKLNPTLLPTLKVVCFRTRSLDEDTYMPWAAKANVILAYGAPDTCPLGISFLDVISPGDLKKIGRPLAGSFWVVNPDDSRKLMPVGAAGDLVIEGPTLGRTYPDAETAASPSTELKPNFNPKTKTTHFKTGHRVRYLEGGVLQFASSQRSDLELGGHAVNLLDMEQHIRRCLGQGIDVMVDAITFRGAKDAPVLVVFIELGAKLSEGSEDLMSLSPATKEAVHTAKQLVEIGLKNHVAPHLIPSIFIPVRKLPMMASLKIDRRRLQKMIYGLSKEQLLAFASTPSPMSVQSIGLKPLPPTQTEEKVRSIWAEVLMKDEGLIGASDGFFDVGGDEVLAVKLVVACRHQGLTASVADVMKNASLTEVCRSMSATEESPLPEPCSAVASSASLTSLASSASPARGHSLPLDDEAGRLAPKLGLDRKDIEEVAETSAMQLRYIESGMLRGRADIDYFTFTLSGAINASKLEEACQVLVSIHPILRTAFAPYNRRVYQAVLKSHSIKVVRETCPGWRLAKLTSKLISEDRLAPIAFNRPITKFTLLDGGKQSCLIMRLSKAQYDHLSVALLVKDLKKLYDGGTNHPPRRPSYCDFIEGTRAGDSEEAQRYWSTLLQGATMTHVVNHVQPYHLSAHFQTLRQKMLVGSLSNLGISFETVLKSAWAMVLASLSALPDVVFGEIIDGRHVRLPSGKSVGNVMGPTINSIPVRIQFPDTPLSPLGLLQYVHGQRISGIPYENLGFLNVVEKCTPWPYWTRFSTLVQHQREETAIIPSEPRTFHVGSAACQLDILESRAQDVPDFLVRSIMRSQGRVELGLTFCTDRVPLSLAEHTLHSLCDTVNMLTSVGIMQPIIPTSNQYLAMCESAKIPLPPPPPSSAPTAPAFIASLSPSQIQQIQGVISKAWSTTLDPRALGVPEGHVHKAAFYDLWGSLIPAAQLAAQINKQLPKLGLPGLLGMNGEPVVSMEEIVDHPTMSKQFDLVVRKIASAMGAPEAAEEEKVEVMEQPKRRASMAGVAKGIKRLGTKVKRHHSSSARVLETTTWESDTPPPAAPAVAADFSAPQYSPSPPPPPPVARSVSSIFIPSVTTTQSFDIVSPLTPSPMTRTRSIPAVSPGVVRAGSVANSSLAASMTTGSSSARTSHEAEEAADVLAPLRSEVTASIQEQVQREKEAVEGRVRPLSVVGGRRTRLLEGFGRKKGRSASLGAL